MVQGATGRCRIRRLIGKHHRADNATSNSFIRAVSPEFVVFSAGSRYRHPRKSTADRLVAFGVRPEDMFRTDRGDNEPGRGPTREWACGAVRGCGRDEAGDDDVEIRLPGIRDDRPKV